MAGRLHLKRRRVTVDTTPVEGDVRDERDVHDGHILIVDDDEANVLVLTRILQKAGYVHITGTTDAPSAVRLAREVGADVVLLDLVMPGVDGFEVLDELRRSVPDGDAPAVVVVTGDVEPDARFRALERGAADVVTKPYDISEIIRLVDELMRTGRRHRRLLDREIS